MTITQQSIEILLDLIEIKVSALQIQDRDDARELNKLRKCRQELLSEKNKIKHSKVPLSPTTSPRKLYEKTSSSF